MRRFRGIVQTNIEPKDHEILWYNKGELLFFNNGEWQPFLDINKLLKDIEICCNCNNKEEDMTKEEVKEIFKECINDYLVPEVLEDYAKKDEVFSGMQGFNEGSGDPSYDYKPNDFSYIAIQAGKGLNISQEITLNGMKALTIKPDTDILATKEDIKPKTLFLNINAHIDEFPKTVKYEDCTGSFIDVWNKGEFNILDHKIILKFMDTKYIELNNVQYNNKSLYATAVYIPFMQEDPTDNCRFLIAHFTNDQLNNTISQVEII